MRVSSSMAAIGWFVAACVLAPICVQVASRGAQPPRNPELAAWRGNLRKVHAKFTGRKGTFAQFGDSITDTMAFWTPLENAPRNASAPVAKAYQSVKEYQAPECWRSWKGPEYGNQSGQTTQWALDNIDSWLKRLNPEVAVVLFGTNDLRSIEADAYARNLRAIVTKCLENGTFVLLTTIPPRHGQDLKAAAFAEAARAVAREEHVPLVDFNDAILFRRPTDWDGSGDQFSAYKDYEVPTLISRDGIHPSNPEKFANDFSESGLRSCGYNLRNYLTLLRYAQVIADLGTIATQQAESSKNRAALDLLTPHPPEQPWFPKAPPLPPPAGGVLHVSTPEQLYAAAARVQPGVTILLEDGVYALPTPLEIKTDAVSLRGASGIRERVVLDGGNRGELVRLTACTGVTIADLTVQNVQWNGIKLNSETGVQKLTIYHCLLHNIWQRFVKGVKVPEKDRERLRPAGCRVQYCLFYNDHSKRYEDDPADTEQNFRGNYIGGIDVMYPRDWTISDNVFVGIHGRTGECRGAVFLWHDVQHCIVERNVFIDCDSGICLGNSFRPEDVKIHCTDCTVRNNFVTRCPENGIYADYTKGCNIVNNTICDPQSKLGRLIRLVHDNDGMLVANNLVCGPPIRIESPSKITLRANLEKDISSMLVNAATGNLRLTGRAVQAIDKGVPLPEVREDIDRKPRGPKPDIGADELKP